MVAFLEQNDGCVTPLRHVADSLRNRRQDSTGTTIEWKQAGFIHKNDNNMETRWGSSGGEAFFSVQMRTQDVREWTYRIESA